MSAGVTSLAVVRATVRQRADMVSSTFCTDAEINSYIRASQQELYDLLVTAYGENYYAAMDSTIVTDGTSSAYDLPADFYKLLGADLLVSGTDYVSLEPFNFNERNRYSLATSTGNTAWASSLRYRVHANTLMLTPLPSAGQTIRLWYVPRLSATGDGDVTFTFNDTIQVGDSVTLNGTVVTAAASPTGNFQFQSGVAVTAAADLRARFLVWIGITGYAGTGWGGSPVLTEAQTKVMLGLDLLTDYPATGSTIVSVQRPLGGIAVFSSSTSRITVVSGGDQIDGVNGWEEYIVVDAAIKALQKEESDVSVLMAQKAALTRRIEGAAANRDAGSPLSVTDAYATGNWWGV